MEPARATLPELDRLGDEAPTAPELGSRHLTARKALLNLGHESIEDFSTGDYLGLG